MGVSELVDIGYKLGHKQQFRMGYRYLGYSQWKAAHIEKHAGGAAESRSDTSSDAH